MHMHYCFLNMFLFIERRWRIFCTGSLTSFGESHILTVRKDTYFEENLIRSLRSTRTTRDSRVADVDPRINLMEVFGRPAVEAALVRQQVVELLDAHLEARHVGWLSCLDPLILLFILHAGGSVRRRSDGGVCLPAWTREGGRGASQPTAKLRKINKWIL